MIYLNSLMLFILSAVVPTISDTPFQLNHVGPAGVSAVIRVGVPEYIEREDTGEFYPEIYGFETGCVEGDYFRPVYHVYIPVPWDVDPELSYRVLSVSSALCPGEPARVPGLSGEGLSTHEVEPDGEILDHSSVELEGVYHLAGSRVALVSIYPFNGTTGYGEYDQVVEFSLSWPDRTGGRRVESSSLLGLLTGQRDYFHWDRPAVDRDAGEFWGLPWARLSVSSSDCYSVTGSELEETGCEIVGSSSGSIRLFSGPGEQYEEDPGDAHDLEEIAIEVDDGGDGVFDIDDRIQFYGQGLNRWIISGRIVERISHRWSTHNVYWLTWGGEPGLRMEELSVVPDGSPSFGPTVDYHVWVEDERIWTPTYEIRTGWAWTSLYAGIPHYFWFNTPNASDTARLIINFVGLEGGAHSVIVFVNGSEISRWKWMGTGEEIFEIDGISINPSSANQLKVVSEYGAGDVAFNWLHIEYPRLLDSSVSGRELLVGPQSHGRETIILGGIESEEYGLFDITDYRYPVRLSGGDLSGGQLEFSYTMSDSSRIYLVDQDWSSVDSISPASPGRIMGTISGGDRIIVVPEEFMDGVWGLVSLYGQRGLDPVVVTTGEVFDEFGQGVRDPGAIRQFVRYAIDSWEPFPEGLILVGDGHYDVLGFGSSQPVSIIPWVLLGRSNGQLDDDIYTKAHSGSDLPEIPVSRIPVDSRAELSTYTAKLITYESDSYRGSWQNRALLIADDEWGKVDSAAAANETYHTKNCEALGNEAMPERVDKTKFYLIEYPFSSTVVHPEKPEARADLINALSQGWAYVLFFGHGSHGQMAHEKVLLSSDISLISNGYRLPVFGWASCDIGHFDLPSGDCMSELMLLSPIGGSITSIAATRGTTSGQNEEFFAGMTEFLFEMEGTDIGTAVWLSKLENYSSSARQYVVLGDGSMTPTFSDEGIEITLPSSGSMSVVDADTLYTGVINTVEINPGSSGLASLLVSESGSYTDYICLGGTQVTYLKYGQPAFEGLFNIPEEGWIEASYFMPVQADTGHLGRVSGVGIYGLEHSVSNAEQWLAVVLSSSGSQQDYEGPEVEMWIEGHRGEENPEISGEIRLRGILEDSSGICTLGGAAGSAILLSINQQTFDVSDYFSYYPDSYTKGEIDYTIPDLGNGSHRLILACWDGFGNSTLDTLDFQIVELSSGSISEALVYPNPGSGFRCFSFQLSSSGNVGISIYTVSGRKIFNTDRLCETGYNQIYWDGLDQDGDPLATGTYVYRIEITGGDGSKGSFVDRLVVLKE